MNRHLTDEEILDLLRPGATAEPRARGHLAQCDVCRARVEGDRELADRIASLAAAIDPPRDVWPALRKRLGDEAVPRRLATSRRIVFQAAAAAAIFVLGGVTGYVLRPDRGTPGPMASTDPLAAAAEVQRTGTDYVEALARFRAVAANSAPGAVEQAREVALAAVHGAAYELAQLHPEDATAREILTLARDPRPAGDE